MNPPPTAKSQIPRYQDLWCWKCQEHTDYSKASTAVRDPEKVGRIIYMANTFSCTICKKKMHAPQAFDPVILKRPAERGCLLIYWILVVIGLAIFCLVAAPWNRTLEILLAALVPTITIFVLAPLLVLRLSARKYAIWKEWAMQRGWREPSLEKRAKMTIKKH